MVFPRRYGDAEEVAQSEGGLLLQSWLFLICLLSDCQIRLPASLYVKGTTIPVGGEGDYSTCRKLKQSDPLSLIPIEPSYMYRCNSGGQKPPGITSRSSAHS